MGRGALLLLLLCPLVFSVQEIIDAADYNTGLASALLGAENPCGAGERQISENDIFSVAGVRVITAMPLADNITSDLSAPEALWSWFAKFPKSATFASPSGNGCPSSVLELYAPQSPVLGNAKLSYRYGSAEKEVQLGSFGPNPVALDLNSGYLREEEFARLYANLSLEINGEISVVYSYRKTTYQKVCHTAAKGTFCGCEQKIDLGTRTYAKQASDARSFLVEIGPVEEVWLNPPLQKRLAGKQTGKFLIFARRMPAKINVSADGRELGWSEPYKFSVAAGECGERVVTSSFLPRQNGVEVKTNETEICPFQLVGKNASYLPFYLDFGWDETAGKKRVNVEYEDWFLHGQNFSREFSVREPAAFSSRGGEGTGEIKQGSDSLSPAFYPAEEKTAPLPDFSPVAALVALPFFGAIYFLSRRFSRELDME